MYIAIARGRIVLSAGELELGRKKIDAADVSFHLKRYRAAGGTHYKTIEYRQKTA
jgi:hypothetical protein